jgi:PAS domain S-box-containing protein
MLADAERIAKFGVWEAELPSGKLSWSAGLYNIFGLDPATTIPSAELFASLLAPDERARMAEKLALMLAGDNRFASDDYPIIRPDGDERYVHIEIAFEKDSAGHPIRAVGTVQDVTDARRARAELEWSHRTLADAERIARFGTWEADIEMRTMRWSAGLYEILGLDPTTTAPTTETFASLLDPETRSRVMGRLTPLFSGERQSVSDDYAIIRPDGVERFVHGEACVMTDDAGRPLRILGTVHDVTQARHERAELERSRLMLADAQRLAQMGSWSRDFKTGQLYWSEEFYRLLGLDPDKTPASAELAFERIHPDDRATVRARLDAMVAGRRRTVSFDYRVIPPDGGGRTIHSEFNLILDDYGRPARLVGTAQDVTEARRTRAELERGQLMLTEAQRIARIGSWEADLLTGEERWSPAFYEITGLDPAEHSPAIALFLSLIHPDDRATVIHWSQLPFGNGDRQVFGDFRLVRPDGAERFVHLERGFLKGANGNLLLAISTIQDITDTKHAAAQLVQSEQNLASAQRIARVGSYEVDLATGEMHWSNGLFELFGLDPAKHQPSTQLFMSLLHVEDAPVVRKRMQTLWAGDTAHEIVDWRIPGPDGTERFFHAQIKGERDQAGRLVRIAGTVQDVTAQRQAETRLQDALQAAQAADRAKSEFLMNMSHELRTPLNAIIGFSDLLIGDSSESVSREKRIDYLRDIRESGQHLLDIINSILDLSKIEAGQAPALDEDLIDIRSVIEWTLRFVQERARKAGVTLEVVAGTGLPALRGDERIFRQALLNLVSNAVKFTRSGGCVRVEAKSNDNGDLAVTVADSGIGMRPEDLPVALRPFGQVGSALTRSHEGTGLGLPLAKKFIELHGGEFEVESYPHRGTTVTITLPQSRCFVSEGLA